ncbi:15457_t:CDS:2, partial [Acaulospora colombiana]
THLEEYSDIITYFTSILSELDPCKPETSLRDNLIHIQDSGLALWLTRYCPDDWQFEALVHPNFNLEGTFIRTVLVDGPFNARDMIIFNVEAVLESSGPIEEKLLVDQLVFESAAMDISGPLECVHMCLQNPKGIASEPLFYMAYNLDDQGEISHLRKALMWVLHNATAMRHAEGPPSPSEKDTVVPEFAVLAVRRAEQSGSASPGRLRSFEFVKNMSDEEWEEWSARIKSMVMGINLRGLEPGPIHDQ